MMLGLPRYMDYQENEVCAPCPKCGIPHTYDCETQVAVAPEMVRKNAPAGTGRPRPPRIAIRKDDAVSAAKSIVRNFETEQIKALIVELEERMRDGRD